MSDLIGIWSQDNNIFGKKITYTKKLYMHFRTVAFVEKFKQEFSFLKG